MAYSLETSPDLQEYFTDAKIAQIAETAEDNPDHCKPLKAPLAGKRRVHVGSFVLLFEILEKERVVRLLRLEHHDSVYKH